MLTVVVAAQRVGEALAPFVAGYARGVCGLRRKQGHHLIDPGALDEVRDAMYPMLPLPPEWQQLEDGTPAPNWVAAVAPSRALDAMCRKRDREPRHSCPCASCCIL